jgi:hypothetical protein
MNYLQAGIGWSNVADPYVAGSSAAEKAMESLKGENANIAFIFSTTDYDLNKMLNGARSVIGNIPQMGASTKFTINNTAIHEKSVTVMVVSSEYLNFGVSVHEEASKNPYMAGRDAIIKALDQISLNPYRGMVNPKTPFQNNPYAIFTLTDTVAATPGKHGGGVIDKHILNGISSISGTGIPIIGGAASEDSVYSFMKTYQFCNWKSYSDSCVCGVLSSRLKLGMGVKHAFVPKKGTAMLITKAGERTIEELNGRPAGKVVAEMDLSPPGSLGIYDPMGDFYWLKSWKTIEGQTLVVNAPVASNASVSAMEATKEDQIKAAGIVAKEAVTNSRASSIGLVFAVNCVGRHRACGEDASRQFEEIKKVVGNDAVIGGFHGYGEHGAPKNCVCGFHNMTLPLLVIADELIE